MDNHNKEHSMYNNNDSDFDKKTFEIKLFSHTNSAQCDYNPAAVKLELFGNISLVSNTNNFEHCRKAIHRVKSSFVECN